MTKKRKAAVADYESLPGMSLTQRVAHFLDWAAKNLRYQYFPAQEVVKAVNGYKKTPRANSKEADSVRSCMPRVRALLCKEYKRGYICQRGVGYRATVNDEDKARYDLADRTKRLASAKVNVDSSLGLIDARKISGSNAEGRRLRSFVRNVKKISSLISDDRIQKLLPPVQEEKE
jgi:hypothetical protein